MDVLVHSLRRVAPNHACSPLSKIFSIHSVSICIVCLKKDRRASNAGFIILRSDAWGMAIQDKSKEQTPHRYEDMSSSSIYNNKVKQFLVGIECIGMSSERRRNLSTFLPEQFSEFITYIHVFKCETNLQLFNHLNIFLIDL